MDHDDVQADAGIALVEETGRSVVRMWGDVDAALRDQASAAMVRTLQRGLPVLVDVADVSFVDSSGLAFILQLHKVGQDEGMAVELLDPPAHVLDLLDMIGMGGHIAVRHSAPDLDTPDRPTTGPIALVRT